MCSFLLAVVLVAFITFIIVGVAATLSSTATPENGKTDEELETWIGIIASIDLFRFSMSMTMLMISGIILQNYLRKFLADEAYWERAERLYDSLRQHEQPSSSSSTVIEAKEGDEEKKVY